MTSPEATPEHHQLATGWLRILAGLSMHAVARGAAGPLLGSMVFFHGSPEHLGQIDWQAKAVFDDRADACDYAGRLGSGYGYAAVMVFDLAGWPVMFRAYHGGPEWEGA